MIVHDGWRTAQHSVVRCIVFGSVAAVCSLGLARALLAAQVLAPMAWSIPLLTTAIAVWAATRMVPLADAHVGRDGMRVANCGPFPWRDIASATFRRGFAQFPATLDLAVAAPLGDVRVRLVPSAWVAELASRERGDLIRAIREAAARLPASDPSSGSQRESVLLLVWAFRRQARFGALAAACALLAATSVLCVVLPVAALARASLAAGTVAALVPIISLIWLSRATVVTRDDEPFGTAQVLGRGLPAVTVAYRHEVPLPGAKSMLSGVSARVVLAIMPTSSGALKAQGEGPYRASTGIDGWRTILVLFDLGGPAGGVRGPAAGTS